MRHWAAGRSRPTIQWVDSNTSNPSQTQSTLRNLQLCIAKLNTITSLASWEDGRNWNLRLNLSNDGRKHEVWMSAGLDPMWTETSFLTDFLAKLLLSNGKVQLDSGPSVAWSEPFSLDWRYAIETDPPCMTKTSAFECLKQRTITMRNNKDLSLRARTLEWLKEAQQSITIA